MTQSIALDLKRGGDVSRRLIERADVVIDNFLPAQRRAVGMDDVRAINPRAIHCAITGYDSDTSDANAPGYDLLAQAGAGLMSITGEPDGQPMKTGVALSDVLTAHHAFGDAAETPRSDLIGRADRACTSRWGPRGIIPWGSHAHFPPHAIETS